MSDTTTKPETIEVNDLDKFVKLLANWHSSKVKVLEHMLLIPDGTVMELDGTDHNLTGDMLIGFRAGLSVALAELGSLPFMYETEVEDAANDSTQPE